jgi:hypothetical protein
MTFKPGIATNPNGRPAASRNNRTKEVIQKLISNGFKDPLITLSELSANSEDAYLRAQASNMLAPYIHSKNATRPISIYLDHPVTLPHKSPRTLEEVRANIIYLTDLKLNNLIDKEYGDNLILDQRHLHDSIFEELKLLYSQGGSTNVTIHVEGGLPEMPGTDIIKPAINGGDPHALLDTDHGRVDAPPQRPTIDSAPNSPQSAEKLAVQPCQAATPAKVPPGPPEAPALSPGAMRGHVAGNGQPPPPPPPLKSQVPQRAADIKPEFRDKYLAERQLRFPHTYAWDGFLWIDSV